MSHFDENLAKRNFSKTPEPRGTLRRPPAGRLRFVVQLHAATMTFVLRSMER